MYCGDTCIYLAIKLTNAVDNCRSPLAGRVASQLMNSFTVRKLVANVTHVLYDCTVVMFCSVSFPVFDLWHAGTLHNWKK